MELADVYTQTRTSLLDLGSTLDDAQLALPVAPTPGWVVRDVFAHLCGCCCDVLDGNMEGGGSPPWTAEQIRVRSDKTLAEIGEEWSARAPELEALLRSSPPGRMSFPVYDVWTHAQDVRAAVGLLGERDERAAVLAAAAVVVFDGNFGRSSTPAARVVTESLDTVLGEGEPVATLRTDDYELLRMMFGRRSKAQCEAAGWEGDAVAVLDELHLFPYPETDIQD